MAKQYTHLRQYTARDIITFNKQNFQKHWNILKANSHEPILKRVVGRSLTASYWVLGAFGSIVKVLIKPSGANLEVICIVSKTEIVIANNIPNF